MSTSVKTRAKSYAARNKSAKLEPFAIDRRDPGPHDVAIDIEFCGLCHSDIHQARDEWGNTVWPCVPGHEIVGTVADIGPHVTKFKKGDIVGVGCMVDSCRQCEACRSGDEQYCEGRHGALLTYNGWMKNPDGTKTFGGYSDSIVVNEDFVLRIPDALDRKAAAPLLCSAVTVYSPMKHFKIGSGDTVGIVGIGGLGHIAIKIAKALGANVIAITRSREKAEDAKRFGASRVIVSTDEEAMKAHAASLDYILSTIPEPHDVNPYVTLLKRDGRITLVGVLAPLPSVENMALAASRISLGGSMIGSIAETQDILDFCGEHGIASEVEVISMERVNEAMDAVVSGTVRYRYVIDASTV